MDPPPLQNPSDLRRTHWTDMGAKIKLDDAYNGIDVVGWLLTSTVIRAVGTAIDFVANSCALVFPFRRSQMDTMPAEIEMDDIYSNTVREKERNAIHFPSGTCPLYYRKVGNGPEVFLLIHGMVASSAFYEENMLRTLSQSDRLRSTFIIPDLAGYGKSLVDPLRNYSVEEQVELLIRDVLYPEGIEHFNLIGHSYGGLIALHLAGTIPHQIASLMLLAPAYFSDPFAFNSFLHGGNASALVRWVGRLETSPYLLRMVNVARPVLLRMASCVPHDILPVHVFRDLFETRAHTTIMTILGIRATGDLSMNKMALKNLRDRDLFITVFHGDEDWVVPVSNSQLLVEDYPRSKLVVLRGVGHLFPVTAAQNTLKMLMREHKKAIMLHG